MPALLVSMLFPPPARAQERVKFPVGVSTIVLGYGHLLSAYSVRRSWAEKNRPLVVRFLKAVVRAKKWFEQERNAASLFTGARRP